MQINKITNYNTHFGSSQVNIASMADSHGDILSIPHVIKTIQENRDTIFEKKNLPSTQNVLAIVGDYYMNPGGNGILTDPQKTFGDVQDSFLHKLIYEVARNFSQNQRFDTVYTPGNHCFGAGDIWLFDRLYKAPMSSVITNVNLEKSPIIDKIVSRVPNITSHKVYEVPDSKNPDIKNHVLFLGVTIPSMYYNMHNIKHTVFYDQTTKNDASMTKDDFKETIVLLKNKIKEYKKQYPNGAVVLMSHTGNKISNIFAENVDGIDVILNAHDHRDYSTMVGKTQILSHGQNNKFLRSVNLMFDDNGKLYCVKSQKFETAPYIRDTRKDSYLQKFVKSLLKKDLVPLLYLDKSEIKTKDFIFSNDIRYKNTLLMNYITTALGTEARKVYPSLDAVGIPATIIRNGLFSNNLRTTFNNIDLLNMFKGVDTNVSRLRIGKITGEELTNLIVENALNNIESQTRNALIQWSDIQINRSALIRMVNRGANNLSSTIKIRNRKTGVYEPIRPKKQYTIILADKYLIKDTKSIQVPKLILKKFERIPETYRQLFKQYLDNSNAKVNLTEEMYEKRII